MINNLKRSLFLFLTIFCIVTCLSSTFAIVIGGSDGFGDLGDFNFSISSESKDGADGTSVRIEKNYGTESKPEWKIIDQGSAVSAWEKFYSRYRTLINLIYGLMILTCLAGLIICALKLGSIGDNPQGRQAAIMGILFCGGGVALLGIAGVYFAISMNLLQ